MKTVLLGILFLCEGAVCAPEYSFSSMIRHIAVTNRSVFVVTDSHIHQMRHDLDLQETKAISNTSHENAVTIFLPFEANGTLITCGTLQCGYCELLDITNISRSVYMETMQPFVPQLNKSSVAFLVDYSTGYSGEQGPYMLVGNEGSEIVKVGECSVHPSVTLRNTLPAQIGGIFSKTADAAESNIEISGVKWIDGFQVHLSSSPAKFESYLFANVSVSSNAKVVFLKMDNKKKKTDMTKSLKAATLQCCDDEPRQKIVSSTFIMSGSSVLWLGIFTAEHPHHRNNTVLAVYNITAIKLYDPPEEIKYSPPPSKKV